MTRNDSGNGGRLPLGSSVGGLVNRLLMPARPSISHGSQIIATRLTTTTGKARTHKRLSRSPGDD